MEAIQKSGFILEIRENGEVVRQYHDSKIDRFMSESKKMINDHLNTYGLEKHEGDVQVKNITINVYTY